MEQNLPAGKAWLNAAASGPLAELAGQCVAVWHQTDALDTLLGRTLRHIPACHLLYAWEPRGNGVSSAVHRHGADLSWRGRDLSQRPYMAGNLPYQGMTLTDVYLSQYTQTPCISAIQAVRQAHLLLGFVAADFAVSDLVGDKPLSAPALHWRQFRGDPAVRGTVFMQSRVQSTLDDHIGQVLELIDTLIREHGVYHCKIHFSSGRCSFWLVDDPYNYRLHSIDEINDPGLCLAYPRREYPEQAQVAPAVLPAVLERFKALRFADETLYLRSASLNVMNGMVGLTFSCDGSHYMPLAEFLAKDLSFWVGTLTPDGASAA